MQKTITEYDISQPMLSLNYEEAAEWAVPHLHNLGKGATFTSKSLFNGLQVGKDNRERGPALDVLRDAGLIEKVGPTTEDQEERNNGYATLWRVKI